MKSLKKLEKVRRRVHEKSEKTCKSKQIEVLEKLRDKQWKKSEKVRKSQG